MQGMSDSASKLMQELVQLPPEELLEVWQALGQLIAISAEELTDNDYSELSAENFRRLDEEEAAQP